ncbi:MAG: hypothetical protein EPN62_13185 [Candidimonas sp.]|nr:MAG: hypothetical protein EPN77_11360 [Candidimonas sp.]TAM21914.1 MAG: hypothetical protein EPN62_13185 [Candidimonas sp.]
MHWLAVALVLIYVHGCSSKGSTIRALFKWAHSQFGIVILLVMLPRIIVRDRDDHSPIVPLLGIANRLWSPDAWNSLGITLRHVPMSDETFSEQLEDIRVR